MRVCPQVLLRRVTEPRGGLGRCVAAQVPERRAAVAQITQEVESEVQRMLDELSRRGRLIDARYLKGADG